MSTTYQSSIRPELDPGSDIARVFHDPESSWNVSTTIVLAVQSLTGDEPTEMLPLNRAVDPDMLVDHLQGPDRSAQVTFEFHGYEVSVRDDGQVTFSPLEEV